jgi:hypothetical protein
MWRLNRLRPCFEAWSVARLMLWGETQAMQEFVVPRIRAHGIVLGINLQPRQQRTAFVISSVEAFEKLIAVSHPPMYFRQHC